MSFYLTIQLVDFCKTQIIADLKRRMFPLLLLCSGMLCGSSLGKKLSFLVLGCYTNGLKANVLISQCTLPGKSEIVTKADPCVNISSEFHAVTLLTALKFKILAALRAL